MLFTLVITIHKLPIIRTWTWLGYYMKHPKTINRRGKWMNTQTLRSSWKWNEKTFLWCKYRYRCLMRCISHAVPADSSECELRVSVRGQERGNCPFMWKPVRDWFILSDWSHFWPTEWTSGWEGISLPPELRVYLCGGLQGSSQRILRVHGPNRAVQRSKDFHGGKTTRNLPVHVYFQARVCF